MGIDFKTAMNATGDTVRLLSGKKDTFRFECQACGRCCGAFTIVLSPYDILRLRKATGRTTSDLLKSGIIEIRQESFARLFGFGPVADFLDIFGLARDDTVPAAFLRFRSGSSDAVECHFLEEAREGKRLCSIYDHRPTMCRLHPLGCSTVNGRRTWFFRRPLCGTEGDRVQTVGHWLSASRASAFLAANRQFLAWMRVLLDSPVRFTSLPQGERESVERILYDFDSLPRGEEQVTFREIGELFGRWQAKLRLARQKRGY
ncbi:MAG: YkgJ family cysteine cluster protein [Candidatus Abyssobacteria bacterium SURF_5]|uniref:YkgJ family cysteine cluster protein n=1 Tax=Abyssobacteria bacterium (strain SURF_5) TaxID=2093360 RepID=A0A3A4NSN3_ABYX5|nr:MAG: YkgJ family cysteine cluster protein [Candidatus Abyssubacteria bacterium SURF_5]